MKNLSNFFVAGLVACCFFFLCGCTSVEKEFLRRVYDYTATDKSLSDMEWKNLMDFVEVDGPVMISAGEDIVSISDKETLGAYLDSRNVDYPEKKEVQVAAFDSMTVMLENSSSMAGYSKAGNSQFTAPILALFNAVDNDVEIATAYVGGSRGVLEVKSVLRSDFESALTNGKVASSDGSPLNQIIDMIVDSVKSNSVYCLITDGIVSGTNNEINSSENKEFTKRNLPLMEQRVRMAFGKAEQKNIDLLLYRLTSTFSGIYYDYKNGHHDINGVERPYFIMFFGDRQNLVKIHEALSKESGFVYSNLFASYQVEDYNTVTRGLMIPMAGLVVNTGECIINFGKKVPDTPVNFKVRVRLDGVPEYYKSEQAILGALEFYYDNNGNKVNKNEYVQSVTAVPDALDEYDILFQIDNAFIERLPAGGLTMWVKMNGSVDGWYKELSSDYDLQYKLLPDNKTFGFSYFMEGVKNGYGYNKGVKDVVNVKIQLTK